jgi:hypothetical protein
MAFLLYQLQSQLAIHRMFTLRENMLLFGKRTRKYELEPVLPCRIARGPAATIGDSANDP